MEFLHRLPNHQICIIMFFSLPSKYQYIEFNVIFYFNISFNYHVCTPIHTHLSCIQFLQKNLIPKFQFFFFFYQIFTFLKTSFGGKFLFFSDISPYSFDVENFSYLRAFHAIKLCSTQKVTESTCSQNSCKTINLTLYHSTFQFYINAKEL